MTAASRGTILQGEAYPLALEPGPLRTLLDRVRAWSPDVAVVMDAPSDALTSAWRVAASRTRFAVTRGRLSGDSTLSGVASWLELPLPRSLDGGCPLLDTVPPCFDRDVLEANLARATREFHRLAARLNCSYRRRVSGNRFYAPIAREVRGAWGCTFCFLPVLVGDRPLRCADIERDIALVLRQVVAHQAATPSHVTAFNYWLDQGLAGEHVHLLLERLARLDLRPTRVTTLLRPDQFLARIPALERVLPRMAERGHRLDLVSVGADNLSATENARFNKGISPARVLAAREAAQDLERRWPEAFSCLDFSWILFTPWTRLSDLRDNILGARRMGPGVLKGILGTVLQLWEGTPITALARRDGAIADRFEGSLALVEVSNVPPANVREVPWRFLDPTTRRAHEVLSAWTRSPTASASPRTTRSSPGSARRAGDSPPNWRTTTPAWRSGWWMPWLPWARRPRSRTSSSSWPGPARPDQGTSVARSVTGPCRAPSSGRPAGPAGPGAAGWRGEAPPGSGPGP